MIRLVFHHATDGCGNRPRGRFAACIGDQQLCISQNPFAAAARVLINAGHDPETEITARPAGANHDTVTMSLGEAAKWTIEKSGTVVPFFRAEARP